MAKEKGLTSPRRSVLNGTAALVTGGVLGGAMAAYSDEPEAATSNEPPPLPWEWPEIDPLEAGRLAYRTYFIGGCGHGTYFALLSLLKERVGHPWTSLPDKMMIHAAAGYGGHGTLCGALGGTSLIINLVAYKDGESIYKEIIDRLYYWYSQQEFPTNKFDDISEIPNQVQVKAMSPLCHTSVTKWMVAAGATVTSKEKQERCAKVAGEVVYVTVKALNEYFAGNWTPPLWKPAEGTEHCVACHGPDDMFHTQTSSNAQQGHMDCLLCHNDHTK